ncbi:phosphate/phosphite/phosphonate ABC transporter substrate-binding protein [Natrialbaceae archaeon A-CW3]
MVRDNKRRKVLKTVGLTTAIGAAGLAGCLGDDDAGEAMDPEDFPEFDPENPEFPQVLSTLFEHGFEVGTDADLEAMERRDEPRYGNPVREPPENDDDRIDPDPLVYAHAPAEDPAGYEDAVAPLMENIEAETGREVDFYGVNSHAAQVEAMRSERMHIGHFSPGSLPFAVNMAGAVPISKPVADGTFGYRLFLVTHIDNPDINSLQDLEGMSVAHVDGSSNSGHLAPMALFRDEGVVPGDDYEYEFSGGHDTSLLGVMNRDYDAAPIASIVAAREEAVDPDELKVVWASDPYPVGAVSYRYNLVQEVQDGIERALLDYDYAGTEYEAQLGHTNMIPVDYATHYDIMLGIHEENGIEYEEDEIDD